MPGGYEIRLEWPPAALSGHNAGHWRSKAALVRKHRDWAKYCTLAACIPVPDSGDIPLSITFYPPNNRGDRTNYVIRAKALIDGVAEGLGVNDKRFLPQFVFAGPDRDDPRVVVVVGG